MSIKAKIALVLAAVALFVVAGLAMRKAQQSLDQINPTPTQPLESARLWQTQPSDGSAPSARGADDRPFDWKAVPFIVLGIGAILALVGTMAFVLGRAMPDALSAPDIDDTGAGDVVSTPEPRE
jgi:hypothetical protein